MTIQEYKDKMAKTLVVLDQDLKTVRAGRANASLLDQIAIEYYGSMTPVKNVASISTPDPRSIMISPFDPKILKDIEKAIQVSDIGINPSNDGKNIRLVIPPLTEDRRKELAKSIKKMGEDAKVAVRNVRRDMNDSLKKAEKASEITEDELKKQLDEVQKLNDKCIKDIDSVLAEKEKELMEI